MWEIGKKIVREEGFRGLAKGIVPRVAKVAPSCAIMISSYEFCKKHIVLRRM
jgi:solute carrier family 25 protein 39/40